MPNGMDALRGATAIDLRVADVTVSTSGGLTTDAKVAVTEVVPAVSPLATPCVP